jgi:hypothetical protein
MDPALPEEQRGSDANCRQCQNYISRAHILLLTQKDDGSFRQHDNYMFKGFEAAKCIRLIPDRLE